ncbi:MAG: hypothetical protein H7328_06510 [Bdellovibrio sp.]|nr:hypothetical protein [Bdellovibrio sp.]
MKKSSTFILLLSLSACGLLNRNDQVRDVEITQLNLIKLDQPKEEVKKILGPAEKSYIVKFLNKDYEGVWIYSEKARQSQRAAISFDISTNKVIGKTFIPKEDELEENFNFVFNEKFKEVKFIEIPLKKCIDFSPTQSFYFNIERGLSIAYNRRLKVIESISWTSPKEIKDHIDRIQACQKNESEMIEKNW